MREVKKKANSDSFPILVQDTNTYENIANATVTVYDNYLNYNSGTNSTIKLTTDESGLTQETSFE